MGARKQVIKLGGCTVLYVMATWQRGEWAAPVKVGITSNVRKRLKSVQTSCPFPVTIYQLWDLQTEATARFLEGAFHHLQRKHRTAGEWFEIPPVAACYFIESYCREAFVLCGAASREEVIDELGPIHEAIPTEPVWGNLHSDRTA